MGKYEIFLFMSRFLKPVKYLTLCDPIIKFKCMYNEDCKLKEFACIILICFILLKPLLIPKHKYLFGCPTISFSAHC